KYYIKVKILKFGGSSVGTVEAMEQVLKIIKHQASKGPITVTVSALGGITDQLQQTAIQAARGDKNYQTELLQLEGRHIKMVQQLISVHHQSKALAQLKMMLNEL